MQLLLPDDQAGSRPGSRPTSFASPKDVGEKRRPRRWRSAARTPHVAGTEIGKRPKLAALRQRTLLYPISAPATWRHQRGFHCNGNFTSNGNGNGNCRCAERQRQRQLSLRGTSKATATVAARSKPLPLD